MWSMLLFESIIIWPPPPLTASHLHHNLRVKEKITEWGNNRERESNHWRESREGWHNEGWPLGRAETGLHRQPGLSQRKYRDGHRVTETPPGARDGELLVTEHRLLGERSRQFWSWNNYGKTLSWHTWHVVSVVSWGQPRLFWNVWVLTSTELIFSTPDGFNEKQKHWRLKLDEKSSVQFSKGWADNY